MGEEMKLAVQIAEAVQALHTPTATADARKAANQFILTVPELPCAVNAATQLAGPDAPPAVRFFAFQLVGRAAAAGRLPPQDPRAGPIREVFLDMTRRSTLAVAGADLSSVPQYVREKYSQALAAVAVFSSEWPAGWPNLQPELLEAGKTSHVHAALALTFFRGVGEVLQSDAASRLSSQRRKALQAHITESCGDVFKALQHYVGLFPGIPSLDKAAVLLTQELAGIVPVTKFLADNVDRFLLQKLSDASLRMDVLRAITEWLGKNIAKELKEAPDRMKELVFTVCDLARSCRTEGLTAEEYEVHKAVAMMLRDFTEANKAPFERSVDLQAKVFSAAVQLMRYPSLFIQAEATSIVPHLLKAALPTVQKGGVPPAPQPPPPWLNLDGELLPLLFLSTHKQIPANFDLFPLPPDYRQIMAFTAELDVEEDLPSLHTTVKGRIREILMALTPSAAAILKCLEFVHGLLPRVLGVTGAGPGDSSSIDPALSLAERVMQNVKLSAGPQALQACRTLLLQVLQARVPGPEFELRRLEFLSRCGATFDLLVEGAQDPENAIVVQVFTHIFGIIEVAGKELRAKALYASIGVCKAAPKAIRPVLEPIVAKAAGLLTSVSDNQHVLCEALVAASTAAQNFEQQRNLVRNLFAPLVARWSPLVEFLSQPGHLEAALLGDRTQLDSAMQLVRCFECCFRASVVPADPAVATAGGFGIAAGGDTGVTVRNPAGELVGGVLPGLIALLRAFHAVFASDVTRLAAGPATGGVAQVAPKEELLPYLLALDAEELRALTSSLDNKAEEPGAWENAFPPPPGQDPARVLQGRSLLYGLRLQLYKCLGAALAVQDGSLTHPELPAMLAAALIDSTESVHPYHLELQLRHVWMALFGTTGMLAAGENLRKSLTAALLPRMLSAAACTLDRYWKWLNLPEGHPAAGANGQTALLWAMCTGTVMASRTFVDMVISLVTHGGVVSSLAAQGPQECDGDEAMGKKNRKKKGSAAGDAGDGAGRQGQGFAATVCANAGLLEAVQRALCIAAQWQDPKSIGHVLVGMRAVAVRLMSGGETHHAMREFHAASLEAPKRCDAVLRLGLQPLISLAGSPPPPPCDGAMQTVIGKPFADFFSPEREKGRVGPSPFASGIVAAVWPIIFGLCLIFAQVCNRANAAPEMRHIASFPALLEVCQMLCSMRRIAEPDVQQLLTTFLDREADQKVKRNALRAFVRKSVDPEPAPGETLA